VSIGHLVDVKLLSINSIINFKLPFVSLLRDKRLGCKPLKLWSHVFQSMFIITCGHSFNYANYYACSQTCIKRSPLGQRKSGFLRQVTSYKRFNSCEIIYDRTRKMWPFNTGDRMGRFDCTLQCIHVMIYLTVRE
jgi:hypothetical protein